ncbi:adenine phosphoribosyltransferase [Chromatiales bacterium (ex Bugula neritina AB1)]|nr:adenine phosphoribosyltransferase [Chromatiales bacterium (ex Bugula neritina AB1)]
MKADQSEYFSNYIHARVRTIADWPAAGVQFRDITPLLQNPATFRRLVDCFVHRYYDHDIDVLACIDARGFIIGGALAYELSTSLVPIRKRGKLPFETVCESYELEYGTAEVELHKDAISKGQRVLVLDDLIATGGTMLAACSLITRLGGTIEEVAAIIDLPDLQGSKKLREAGFDVFSICEFEGE